MCLTFFYINPFQNKDFPFKYIQAFNREEAYERNTDPLNFWEDDPNIIGGRDHKSKGTWLGINIKTGNIAFLTNLPIRFMEAPPSSFVNLWRGLLVSNFLRTDFFEKYCDKVDKDMVTDKNEKGAMENYLKEALENIKDYRGFNLVLGNLKTSEFWFLGNEKIDTKPSELKEGFHMMTNFPFPKMLETVEPPFMLFKELVQKSDFSTNEKKNLMIEETKKIMKSCNRKPFPGSIFSLNEKGEKVESIEMFGTKTATLILVSQENKLEMIELTYDEESNVKNQVEKEIQL